MNIQPKAHRKIAPGIWILAVVLALFAARWVWSSTRLPSDIKDVVRQLASARIIQKPAVANHAGTLTCVVHTTGQGVGVFFVDTKTQSEIALTEWTPADYKASWMNLLGWSPDGRVFAYAADETIRICNGNSGERLATISLTNRIQSLAWFSPRSCAYVDEMSQLHCLEAEEGSWLESKVTLLPADNGRARSVVALGTNGVAWQTDNAIWQMEISSGAVTELFSDRPNRIAFISFSRNAGAFLVTEATTNRTPTYILGRVTMGPNGQASGFEEWHRGPSILDAQWINQGKGYAYRATKGDNTVLVIKRDDVSPRETMFPAGQVWNLFCDGESPRAYVVAAKSSEPAGVWRCEPDTGEPRYAFSPWESEKVNFHFQPALVGYAPYGGRHSARFTVVPPVNFSRHKKYPLVIGTAGYEWTPIAHGVYAQALARCGAFVALVNYRWNQSRPETIYEHTNNVLAVYDQLTANPSVDRDRIYLFGFSAGTLVVKELAEQHPGRWRGIMLMNPSVLPEPGMGLAGSVLLTAGSTEGEEERFKRYQEGLCKVGIPSTWFIHEDEQHVVRGQEAFFNRTLLMIDAVFDR